MNYTIRIPTTDEIDPNELLQSIEERYPIIILSDEFPMVSFLYEGRSFSPIRIQKTDQGYEIYLNPLSSEYDFYCVSYVVSIICDMTFANGYEVMGDECGSDDFFIQENFERGRDEDVSIFKPAIYSSSFIEIPGVDFYFYIGKDFLRRAGVTITSDNDRFFRNLTSALSEITLQLLEENCNAVELRAIDDSDFRIKVTKYRYPDDNDIDYLAFGDVVLLEDAASNTVAEIMYGDLHKIVPDGWTLIDEQQYNVVPFTNQSWEKFFKEAQKLQKDDASDTQIEYRGVREYDEDSFEPPDSIGSSFGYDYRDGSHQDFGFSKEDVDLLLEFGKAIESGTSDYYNQALLECDLGILYEKGIGVKMDCHKAVYWYEKAAADGDDYARCNLADILRKGTGGVEKDWKRAFEVYKTVKQPYGPFRVGYMYEHGMGVEKDMIRAIEWYEKGRSHFLAAKRLKELGIDPNDADDFI